MKYIAATILTCLTLLVLFSGCVANEKEEKDLNMYYGTNTNSETEMDSTYTSQDNTDNYTDSTINNSEANEESANPESMIYCIINMGEVKQEFFLAKNEIRMDTYGANGVWTKKTINRSQHCTLDNEGRYACIPAEDFDATKEGWYTVGKTAGQCSDNKYEEEKFRLK